MRWRRMMGDGRTSMGMSMTDEYHRLLLQGGLLGMVEPRRGLHTRRRAGGLRDNLHIRFITYVPLSFVGNAVFLIESRPWQQKSNIQQDRMSSSSYDQQPSSTRNSAYNNNPTTGNTASVYSSRARSPSVTAKSDGGQPTFLKIKIFHSSTDDLIAIRVSPRVTYLQLLSKVKDRLGADVSELKYRQEGSSNKVTRVIQDDEDLKEWVGENSKLVLFAY